MDKHTGNGLVLASHEAIPQTAHDADSQGHFLRKIILGKFNLHIPQKLDAEIGCSNWPDQTFGSSSTTQEADRRLILLVQSPNEQLRAATAVGFLNFLSHRVDKRAFQFPLQFSLPPSSHNINNFVFCSVGQMNKTTSRPRLSEWALVAIIIVSALVCFGLILWMSSFSNQSGGRR